MSSKHYINNDKFEELIRLYKLDPKEHENELFEMFDLLITNILTGFSFNLDEDDAKQECFLLILKTLKNFKLLYTKNKKYIEKIDAYTEIKKDSL